MEPRLFLSISTASGVIEPLTKDFQSAQATMNVVAAESNADSPDQVATVAALTGQSEFQYVIYDNATGAPYCSAASSGGAPIKLSGYSSPVGLTPAIIRHAYGIDQLMFGSIVGDGTGQTIAIVDAYDAPTIVADFHAFNALFFPGQPEPTLTVVGQDGSSTRPGTDPAGAGWSWAVETSMDVEWAHVVAPKANILLVEANSNYNSDLYTAVNTARNYTGVSALSMSWGGGEGAGETSLDSYFTTPSGHTGVTFLASSGDGGAGVIYPSASPNVVAVGGTTLHTDGSGNYLSESGWSGSGGGASYYEPMPSYQKGVVTQVSHRAVPDVAADADPSSGVAVMDTWDFGSSTPWLQIGGTSLSSPLWAGFIALVNQGRVINGYGTLDGATETLPKLYALSASAGVRDITAGSNGYPCTTGYDLVTGIGSPVVNTLLPLLAGAGNPLVAYSTPSGIVIGTVGAVDFVFNKAMDTTSFSVAADVDYFINQNGNDLRSTITGFSWTNSTTLHVTFNALTADYNYYMVIGPQILSADGGGPMDQSRNGIAGQATDDQYWASFLLDSILIQPDSSVPANNSIVTQPFTTLRLHFNEPYLPESIGVDDLSLSQGTVTGFQLVDSRTVQYSLAGVNNDGTMTVSIAAGAVQDAFYNFGGAYTGTFTLDLPTRAFPTPLASVNPSGSLVYSSTFNASFFTSSDVDNFTIALDAGQTFTVVAHPIANMQLVLTLTGPGGGSLGSVTSASSGKDAMLQTVPVTAAGTYTITVNAVGSATGAYTLQATLNAAAEAENHNGPSDDTQASAQNLDGSFISLGGGAQRGAVMGTVDGAVEAEPNDSIATANGETHSFNPYSGNLYQLGLTGAISSSSNWDWYNIGALDAGDVLSVSESGSPSSRGTLSDCYVELYRYNGGSPVLVASNDDGGPGYDSLLLRNTVTTADTYYVVAEAYDSNTGTYALGVLLENTGAAPITGGNVTTETEPNDSAATATNAFTSWRAVQYVSQTAASISSTSDVDYYAYSFTAGDRVTVRANSTSSLVPRVWLYNSSGSVVALEDGTSTNMSPDSWVYSCIVPSTGTYYFEVGSYSGAGAYTADVYLSTTTAPPAASTGNDWYSFALAASDTASVAFTGTGSVALKDTAGNTLVTCAAGATNFTSGISNFVAPSAGQYYLLVTGSVVSDYTLVVTRNAGFDTEPNDTVTTAQSLVASPSGSRVALGYVKASATNINHQVDDGTQEDSIGIGSGGDVLWLNAFDTQPGGETISSIQLTWGAVSNGVACSVLVYQDPNGDGNPSDAVLLTSVNTTVVNAGTNTFTTVTIPATHVSGKFFIGALVRNQAAYPAPLDETSSAGQSWIAWAGSNTLNVTSLSSNSLSRIDDLGFPGNWLLRAVSVTPADSDFYSISANAGDLVTVTTATPGDGAGQFVNGLDPKIEVYDSSNNLIGSDDNSASDHRNATLSFRAPSTGVYKIHVVGVGTTQGEYVLTAGTTDSPPTDIALSNATVREHLASGTAVGTFATTDLDTGDTFTYSLVSGAGSDGNAAFSVSGNQLLTAASFDYDTQSSYSVRVRSTDHAGQWTEKAFTVSVLPTMGLKVWVEADPTVSGDYGVRIWAQIIHPIAGEGLSDTAITLYTPGSVGVTVPVDDGGMVVTDWNAQVASKYMTIQAMASDIDGDGDSDAQEMSIGAYSKNLSNLGVTPVLLATETWTMVSHQFVPMALSVASNSRHWTGVGTNRANFDYVTVVGTNVGEAPPTANDDAYTIDEDSGAHALNVLANDTDPDNDGFVVVETGSAGHGTVSFTDSGVSYTPAHDFYGTDHFTYTIRDGHGNTDDATVTMTVNNVNDPPTANNDAYTINEDSGANTLDVLANDTYLPDPPETLTIIGTGVAQHGTVTIVGQGTAVTYTPAHDYYGQDAFTYTISDGNGGTATASVALTVNSINDDVQANNDTVTVFIGSSVQTVDVLANDRYLPNPPVPLTVTSVGPAGHGTASLFRGQVTYVPQAGFVGTDTFTYTVSADHGDTGTATVTVSVIDPPRLKVWLTANPVASGEYSVNIWAQVVHETAGQGISDMAVTLYTPGSVGVTSPEDDGGGMVVTNWNSQIASKCMTIPAMATDVDTDGDPDAQEMSIGAYSKNLPDLGVTAVLVATETWTMNSDQPVQLAVSVSSASRHWATGTTRVAFDYIETVGLVVPPWPVGDVSHDNVVDASDIDQLYAHFGDTSARYDLNGDGVANQADEDYLVHNVLNTWYADANLDGKVGFGDFQVLLDNWDPMGINAIRGWARGDFNADGKIGFGDFQLMLDNWNPMGVHSPLTTLDGGAATAISAPTALADDAPATLSLVTTSAATISAATTANLTVPTAMPHRTQVASADPASPIATSPAQAAVVDLLSQSRAQMSATNRRQVVLGLAQRPWFRAGPPDQHAVTRKPALRHQTAGHSLAALESDRIDILSPVIAPVMVQS